MVIEAYDGVAIPFSLFPNEKEILFYPNTRIQVVSVLQSNFKALLQIPETYDVIEFKQVDDTLKEASAFN